ncbi:MAG: hypothetical protein ABEI97_05045 [Candidatus Nanohaloarchaea archaeon]
MALSEEEQIQQIVQDADAVDAYAAAHTPSEPPVDELTVLVHFGFHGLRAAHEGADPDDYLGHAYAEYCRVVYDDIRDTAADPDAAVAALYPDGYEQRHRTVLGAPHRDVDWVPTWEDGAVFTEAGVTGFAETYARLNDGGTVTVTGEDGEKCYQYTVNFLDALQQRGQTSFDIVRGPSYTR